MDVIPEDSKIMEKELVISPFLLIRTKESNSDRLAFYSILEDRYFIRLMPELQNKSILCCHKEWLVLEDTSNHDCSLLNILTMEKRQFPIMTISETLHEILFLDDDGHVLLIEKDLETARSFHLGNSEYVLHKINMIGEDFHYNDFVQTTIIFKGRLYALTLSCELAVADIPKNDDLDFTCVINGESIKKLVEMPGALLFYLVESNGDLLLVFLNYHCLKVVAVEIFKADLNSREWIRLDRLGDRVIFVDELNGLSYSASAIGLKGNCIYIVSDYSRSLHVYDIEDQSFLMSVPCPIADIVSDVFCTSLPEHIIPYCAGTTNRISNSIETIKVMAEIWSNDQAHDEEKLWYDLPNDLLSEIFSRLYPQERVVFKSVCKTWNSIGTITNERFEHPHDPYLMFSNNRIFNPVTEECHYMGSQDINSAATLSGRSYDKFHHMDFLDMDGALVRASRDGWLLMTVGYFEIFFFNPSTKEKVKLPDLQKQAMSMYFSSPPTCSHWYVLVALESHPQHAYIPTYCIKRGEKKWTYCKIQLNGESFETTFCNPIVSEGISYLLGRAGKLWIHNPRTKKSFFRGPPVSSLISDQYMLIGDGKLIGVFVGYEGASVCACEWNTSKMKWEKLESLGDNALFVSRPLSLCRKATKKGTGNRIYFPRLVGSHCVYYSLTTKRLHTSTFAMDTCYEGFGGSKEYKGATWMNPSKPKKNQRLC